MLRRVPLKLSLTREPRRCDLFVIGGGSGGVSCAKRAAQNGASVILADYVAPSPRGSSWGVGGTCVNVGCIPKKLMHTAAAQGQILNRTASFYGWEQKDSTSGPCVFHWKTLQQNVANYVRSLNFSTRVALQDRNIEYLKARAQLTRTLTEEGRKYVEVHCVDSETKTSWVVRSLYVVIATGGRPNYTHLPGALEYAITSDDLFWCPKNPGKVVIVGGGYIALECAGFLASFVEYTKAGKTRKPSVLVRSIPLRGFDREAVERVISSMRESVNFIYDTPEIIKPLSSEPHKLLVQMAKTEDLKCDTVLLATGRTPQSEHLGLETLGVDLDNHTKHIVIDAYGQTSHPQIYALGDVVQGSPDLTPIASRAGRILAENLFNIRDGTRKKIHPPPETIPTTIFTPLEYGRVGLTEEEAVNQHGEKNIAVFHTSFQPLEWTLPGLPSTHCFLKVIGLRQSSEPKVSLGNEKIIGWHLTCPHAGEITQGFAAAISSGLTLQILRETVGIHPTMAECINSLEPKRDQTPPRTPGC